MPGTLKPGTIEKWFPSLNTTPTTQGGNMANPIGQVEKGQNFGFLADYLKGSLEKGMPFKQEFIQQATGNVNRAFNRAGQGMRETFAGKGTFGSGVHAAAGAELAGQRGAAIGGTINQINLQDLEFRKDAIYKLLGLNRFDAESENIAKSMLEETRQFDVTLAEEKRQFDESQPEWWELALSSIGGGISGGLTSGASNAISNWIFPS